MKRALTILFSSRLAAISLVTGTVLLAGCGKPKPPPPAPAKPAAAPAAATATGTNAVSATETNVVGAEFVSTFEMLPKDPFYPESGRFKDNSPDPSKPAPPKSFKLAVNGMLSSSAGTLVSINGRSFSVGETGRVTVEGEKNPVKLTVLQIKRDSVQIKAEGESNERWLPWKP